MGYNIKVLGPELNLLDGFPWLHFLLLQLNLVVSATWTWTGHAHKYPNSTILGSIAHLVFWAGGNTGDVNANSSKQGESGTSFCCKSTLRRTVQNVRWTQFSDNFELLGTLVRIFEFWRDRIRMTSSSVFLLPFFVCLHFALVFVACLEAVGDRQRRNTLWLRVQDGEYSKLYVDNVDLFYIFNELCILFVL